MTQRSKRSQARHDAAVRKIAKGFEQRRYEVKADVSGFQRPDTLGGYRPDVVAIKGRERKIVEVETPESVDSARDLKQQQAFTKAAKRSVQTTFTRKIVKY